jgi:hypothetical protein
MNCHVIGLLHIPFRVNKLLYLRETTITDSLVRNAPAVRLIIYETRMPAL